MNPLVTLTRTLFIGMIWSAAFFAGIRSLMLEYWRFDIFHTRHWEYIWRLWLDGWVIDAPKEWSFVLILFTAIPLWLTGWTAFCIVPWGSIIVAVLGFPFRLLKRLFGGGGKKKKRTRKKAGSKRKKAKKKGGKKQKRPPAIKAKATKPKPKPEEEEEDWEEEEEDWDDEEDWEEESENEDEYEEPAPKPKKKAKKSKPAPKAAPSTASGDSPADLFESKDYKLISDVTIAKQKISHVAVSDEKAIVILVDSEEGDWLADEERFNDEEPLWFSESNHRVSPVRQVLDAKEALEESLSDQGENMDVEALVVIDTGTVINAEDMIEIWDDMSVNVARFGKGGPEELKRLAELVPDNDDGEPDEDIFESVEKAIADSAG